jgi:hypothetical protein
LGSVWHLDLLPIHHQGAAHGHVKLQLSHVTPGPAAAKPALNPAPVPPTPPPPLLLLLLLLEAESSRMHPATMSTTVGC